MQVLVHHGSDRIDLREVSSAVKTVVVTTYGIVTQEAKMTEPSILESIDWDRIVLDEGHVIKNRQTAAFKACCALTGRSRWLVSGTPIQNDINEVLSFLQFIRCSPLDTQATWKVFIKDANRLRALFDYVLLRRTKFDRLENGDMLIKLPQRESVKYRIILPPNERKLYDDMLKLSKSLIQKISSKPQFDSSDSAAQQKQPISLLTALLRLQQICCHPSLTKQKCETISTTDESERDINPLNEDSAEMASTGADTNDDSLLAELMTGLTKLQIVDVDAGAGNDMQSVLYRSAKIAALTEKLEDVLSQSSSGRRNKAVVVSQWTSALDVV